MLAGLAFCEMLSQSQCPQSALQGLSGVIRRWPGGVGVFHAKGWWFGVPKGGNLGCPAAFAGMCLDPRGFQKVYAKIGVYGEKEVSSADQLFKENEKLEQCRAGLATYGYCAWCDAPIGNPNKLWKHYQDSHQVLMQVAPMSPPSAWHTLMGREMGARTPQFQTPSGQFKYWVTPMKGDGIDSYVIGTTQRGAETLVSLGELSLSDSTQQKNSLTILCRFSTQRSKRASDKVPSFTDPHPPPSPPPPQSAKCCTFFVQLS